MKRYYLLALGLILIMSLAVACGDVPIHQALQDSIQKIVIMPLENKTGQPDVDQKLNEKITQAFIVNGRLKVSNKEDADVMLQETLQRYDRIVKAVDSNQVPMRYELQIVVDVDLLDAKTGKTLMTTRTTVDLTPQPGNTGPDQGLDWDSTSIRSLREFTTYYVINNVGMPPEDENAAQERVTDQMAARVVRLIVEGY
jgi:hypothetical protein